MQILGLIAAAAMIAVGVSQNGARDVFNKAAMVCMECIGIG